MRRHLTGLPFAMISGAAAGGACPPHAFTAPEDVRLTGDAVLIVAHATSFHDARYASKRGIDEAVRVAKSRRIPVVYLQDDESPDLHFVDDCLPDHWVLSKDGEVAFDVAPTPTFHLVDSAAMPAAFRFRDH
ncbi:hypothetical protein BURK1_03344 [Burkholderiales bacterium]|nr:hypothetical protein BURK1_03344 [Burkholderiales bacterium]